MSNRIPIDIDNEVLLHFSLQSKCAFPLHKVYVENGIPLPALPYRFEVERSEKITYNLLTEALGYEYPSSSVSSQQFCCWSQKRSAYYSLIEEFDQLRNEANADCVQKVLEKTKSQSISIGMMFAERKETFLVIVNSLERAYKAAKLIRHPKKMFRAIYGRGPTRAELRKLKRTAAYVSRKGGLVADAWLEYRYVWNPLVHDVSDSIQALIKQKAKMYRYSQSATVFFNYGTTKKVSVWAQPYDSVASVDAFYGTHIKYYYDVENPLKTAWSSLSDPYVVAWDLIPWSFVIDWFVDLSTYLDLRSATWGLKFTDGYQSQLRVINTSFSCVDFTVSAWWDPTKATHYASYPELPPHFYLLTDRVVLTDFPEANLRFPLENGLNHKRVADLVALITKLMSMKLNRSLPHNEAYKHAID